MRPRGSFCHVGELQMLHLPEGDHVDNDGEGGGYRGGDEPGAPMDVLHENDIHPLKQRGDQNRYVRSLRQS